MSLESSLAVARLVSSLGKIEGRKRLQKIVHLLKSKGYREFDQEFALHYYGPFSRQLASQIDYLCQIELIDEAKDEGGDAYTYKPVRVMDKGEMVPALDTLTDEHEAPPWVREAESLNEEDTRFLEALSTVVYLHKIGREDERLQREFLRIKPNLAHEFQDVKSCATEHQWI